MPAGRIFVLTRSSRWPMLAGETRKADAMVAASKPSNVGSISGARTEGSMAGCVQANIGARGRRAG